MKSKTKLFVTWIVGFGLMFAFYFAGNPFGIYDDIVIIAGLVLYSFSK